MRIFEIDLSCHVYIHNDIKYVISRSTVSVIILKQKKTCSSTYLKYDDEQITQHPEIESRDRRGFDEEEENETQNDQADATDNSFNEKIEQDEYPCMAKDDIAVFIRILALAVICLTVFFLYCMVLRMLRKKIFHN